MALKILIVPDKFKGTLAAGGAAESIARGWRSARPDDVFTCLPMSDGGDGFGEVLSALLKAEPQTVETVDAADRPCRAQWWWEPKTKTAIIESARIIGLAMLPPKKFHPFELDTFGLGVVLRAAADRQAKRCLIGIGGSATNDGGFGMARALGWQFLGRNGARIERWTALGKLAEIHKPQRVRWFSDLRVAVDVQNPLLGLRGAARVYGPQKGLRPGDFLLAEACLRRLARISRKQFRRDIARQHGAGAAGGLGFGLAAFLGGRLEPGFALFARRAALERQLRAADLVITGEGSIDASTLMGKGVGQVARSCRRLKIPCIGLAGMVSPDAATNRLFTEVHALTDLTTVEEAKAKPDFWLAALAAQVAKGWEVEPTST